MTVQAADILKAAAECELLARNTLKTLIKIKAPRKRIEEAEECHIQAGQVLAIALQRYYKTL